METWKISKQFDFDYGHRVWTQTLEGEYSLDVQCVCKHFHGHRGTVNLFLESDVLNPQGMVWDFKNIGFFKRFLDDVLDHKMILDYHDPALFHFFPLLTVQDLTPCKPFGVVNNTYLRPKQEFINSLENEHLKEVYDGLVITTFVPTSENLSKWLFDIVKEFLKDKPFKIKQVQLYETPKSQSIYGE